MSILKKKEKKVEEQYFEAGRDWFFDRYEAAQIQANRWFLAFVAAMLLAIGLAVAVYILAPLKTLVPMIIHRNSNTGEVWVDRPKSDYVPEQEAEVQADIVRYLTTRESYNAADINFRYKLAMLLSDENVGAKYAEEQAESNEKAPVNVLGEEGTRTVKIEDIVFIDKSGTEELRKFGQKASDLAKIDFVTTTVSNGTETKEAWVATIGWVYKGLPDKQQDAWDNWNGFTVTTYRVDQRNIEVKK